MNMLNKKMTRREFSKLCLYCGAGLIASPALFDLFKESAEALVDRSGRGFVAPKEAMYYKKLDNNMIQCVLCPRNCVLSDGMRGICRVREPKDGKHYTYAYGNPTSLNPRDPIEKKPLFHFLPGTKTLSIATAGCNFRCKCCQNWQISQFPPEETINYDFSPAEVVNRAVQYKSPTIAYTYTEPSIFYEYMLDIAKIAKIRGIKNIYHSNGSLNPEPAEELSLFLDAANIDLKGFTQDFYSKIPEGYLNIVLNTLKILKKNGVWIEITNLIIPTMNDDMVKIKEMCVWIRDNLGAQTPLHFSRFHPLYRLKNLQATPVSTLDRAREVAMSVGLQFVYVGNVPGHRAESTFCPKCNKPVIRRVGYAILENKVDKDGRTTCCSEPIAGVWS